MQHPDFVELEGIEYAASVDFFRAAPPAMRAAYGIEVQAAGAATCLWSRGLEPTAIFRRAVGLGVGRRAAEADVEEIVGRMGALGQRYALPVGEQAQPAELPSWLERRGFTRGYAWMKFSRSCEAPPRAAHAPEVRVAGEELGAAFGRLIAQGFGLPEAIAPWIGALAGRPRWVCLLAYAGADPIAGGAVYVHGSYAWLGFGATLPSHRRQGAQSALLARRLAEAAQRGAKVAVTETGERVPDKPSVSYANILRAGFAEAYLRQNYLSPATK